MIERGSVMEQGRGGSIVGQPMDEACPAAAEPVFARYPPRSAAGLDPERPRVFAERLETFVQHHRSLQSRRGKGGLFVLDITELGRRFAKRWSQAREKAYQLVEGTFARRLNRNDLYVALSGERFLLILTDVERAAAELLARRIASEITDRLCGMIPGGVACRLSTTTLDVEAGFAGVTSLAELEARLGAAEAPAECPADIALAAVTATHEARYTPVLTTRKRQISIYALTPVAKPVTDGREAAARWSDGDEEGAAAVDRWGVVQAASLLATSGFRAALLIRLSYASLAQMRHRQPLMLACRRLPSQARRRLLIELDGLPASLPQARLRELVSYLRPFTVGVVARLDQAQLVGKPAASRALQLPLTEQLAGSGVIGLSTRLTQPPGASSGGGTDSVPADALALLAATANALGLRTLCHVGGDRRLCRAALVAGIDHVLGDALLPSTSRPGRVIALGHTTL